MMFPLSSRYFLLVIAKICLFVISDYYFFFNFFYECVLFLVFDGNHAYDFFMKVMGQSCDILLGFPERSLYFFSLLN